VNVKSGDCQSLSKCTSCSTQAAASRSPERLGGGVGVVLESRA
jgi:hypothetical protein